MSHANSFNLIGIGSNVRFGKGNGFVQYSSGSGFYVQGSDNNTLVNLSCADPSAGTHAVTLEYLQNNDYVNTAGSGITISGQTISLNLGANSGLVDSSGPLNINLQNDGGLGLSSNALGLNYSNLTSAGSVLPTDLIAISSSGTVYAATAQEVVYSSIALPPTSSIGTIIADGTNSSFEVGYSLPNFSGLQTYVSKVKMTIDVAFTGGSVANADITDSSNILMTVSEDNISVPNTYWSELPLTFTSTGSQGMINFLQSDGITPAVPTAGTAIVAIEYVLVGPSGTSGGAGGSVTKIVAGTGLTGGTITTQGTIAIGTTGVTAGTYGNGSNVAQIVVNALGQITSATNIGIAGGGNVTGPLVATDTAIARYNGTTGQVIENSGVLIDNSNNVSGLNNLTANGTVSGSNLSGTNTGDQTITLTGDVTGSGTGSFATTLATVNSDIGEFTALTVNAKGLVTAATNLIATGDATGTASGGLLALTITNTGVTAGTYNQLVVNAKGQITSGTSLDYAVGPAVSTNNAIATFSGSTGGSLQNTSVTIDGTGNISANSLEIGTSGTQLSKEVIIYNTTTNGSAAQLYLDGSSQQLVLNNNSTWLFELKVAARRTDVGNESDVFWIAGAIDRQGSAATTAMVGTADTTNIEQSSNWSVDVSADTTNGALKVLVTGEAGKTVRWTGYVRIVEALN